MRLKKSLALLLALLMLLGMLPASALADVPGVTTAQELKRAFKEAESGSTITLGDDITVTDDYVIEVDTTVTLDMNGKTLTRSSSAAKADYRALIDVTTNGNLTITGNGIINGPTNGATYDGKVVIAVEGTLTYLNGTLNANGSGSDGMYGVYVYGGGTGIFGDATDHTGPTIRSHFAAIGENHMTAPAILNIYGGTYSAYAAPTNNEWWSYFCAPVYAACYGEINISGGTFSGYYGFSDRYMDGAQIVNITGGTFTGTKQALFVDEVNGSNLVGDRHIYVSGGTFNGNGPAACATDPYVAVNLGDGRYEVLQKESNKDYAIAEIPGEGAGNPSFVIGDATAGTNGEITATQVTGMETQGIDGDKLVEVVTAVAAAAADETTGVAGLTSETNYEVGLVAKPVESSPPIEVPVGTILVEVKPVLTAKNGEDVVAEAALPDDALVDKSKNDQSTWYEAQIPVGDGFNAGQTVQIAHYKQGEEAGTYVIEAYYSATVQEINSRLVAVVRLPHCSYLTVTGANTLGVTGDYIQAITVKVGDAVVEPVEGNYNIAPRSAVRVDLYAAGGWRYSEQPTIIGLAPDEYNFKINPDDVEGHTVRNAKLTFTMPEEGNVSATINFYGKEFNITKVVPEIEGAGLTIKNASGAEITKAATGSKVYVTAADVEGLTPVITVYRTDRDTVTVALDEDNSFTMPSFHVTVKATYTPPEPVITVVWANPDAAGHYTVTADAEAITVKVDEFATGFTLKGFAASPEVGGTTDMEARTFTFAKPEGNVTVTIKTLIDQVNVFIRPHGGTIDDENYELQENGSYKTKWIRGTVFTSPKITREGYDLTGFTHKVDGENVPLGDNFKVDNPINIDANWEIVRYDVTAIWNLDSDCAYDVYGDTTIGQPITVTFNPGDNYELTAISGTYNAGRDTLTVSISETAANTATFTMPASDVALEAEFSAPNALVYFVLNDTNVAWQRVTLGESARDPGLIVQEGYTLTWYLNRGLAGDPVVPTEYVINRDTNFYGKLTGNPVSVYFVNDGGTIAGTEAKAIYRDGNIVSYLYKWTVGESYDLPEITKDGSAFAGWYDARGNKLEGQYTVTAAANIYAHWDPLYTVTVASDPEGVMTAYDLSDDTAKATDKITFTVEEFDAELYRFTGIDVYIVDGDAVYSATADTIVFKMPASNVIVTAHFERIPPKTHTLEFRDGDTVLQTRQYTENELPITLANEFTAPVKPGFQFEGWYTSWKLDSEGAAPVTERTQFWNHYLYAKYVPVYTATVSNEIENGEVYIVTGDTSKDKVLEGLKEGARVYLLIEPDEGYELDRVYTNLPDVEVQLDGDDYYIIMADSSVTIKADFIATTHALVVDKDSNVKKVVVTADGEAVNPEPDGSYIIQSGAAVVVRATMVGGYRFDNEKADVVYGTEYDTKCDFTINNVSSLVADVLFTMPAADAKANLATFGQSGRKIITVSDPENGGAVYVYKTDEDVVVTEAATGDTLRVVVEEANGYELQSLTAINSKDGGEITINEDGSFTVLNGNVTITATFKAEVTCEAAENGEVYVVGDDVFFAEDAIVTLGVEPDEGYELSRVYAVEDDVTIDPETLTFEMPDHPVTVKAEFVKKTYTLTYYDDWTVYEDQTRTFTAADLPIENDALFKPTKDGFVFVDWYSNHDLSGDPTARLHKDVTWDVNLFAKWEKIYTVSLTADPEAGLKGYSVTADTETDPWIAGTPMTLTLDLADNYKVKSITASYKTEGDVTLTKTETGYTFKIPEGDVSIKVELEKDTFKATAVGEVTGGSALIYTLEGNAVTGPIYIPVGDTVRLAVEADETHKIDSVYYVRNDTKAEVDASQDKQGYYITMPDTDVTVSAIFAINDPEARIGNVEYATLGEAIEAAGANDTIVLLKDIHTETGIEVPTDKTLTIDLNGYKVCRDTEGATVTVKGELSLYNNGNAETGMITHESGMNGSGVVVEAGATFTMYGGIITGNTAENGAGVLVHGHFDALGGKITKNKTTTNGKGGGVYVDSSNTVVINGTEISENEAYSGAGVYVDNGGALTLTTGSITANTASHNGGGVYVNNGGTFTMDGGSITKNIAADCGGGVLTNGVFTMNGGVIGGKDNGNTAGSDENEGGGGIWVATKGTFTVTGGEISYNNAARGGGVLLNNTTGDGTPSNTFTINGNPVIANNTSNNIYLDDNRTITVTSLTGSARSIGVTLENPTAASTVFTSGAKVTTVALAGVFFSDDDDYTVVKTADSEARLARVYKITTSVTGEGDVTFTVNGKETVYALEGDAIAVKATAAGGWHLDSLKANGKDIVDNAFEMPDEDVEIAATFEKNTYTVKFAKNDTTEDPADGEILTKEFVYAVADDAASYTRTGYTLKGWKSDAYSLSFDVDQQIVIDDPAIANGAFIELEAQWEINTYEVTFDKNNSDEGATEADPQTQEVKYKASPVALTTDPTRIGYTLKGWALDAYAAVADAKPVTDFVITDNTTLYAIWKANEFIVKLDPNASSNGSLAPDEMNIWVTFDDTYGNAFNVNGNAKGDKQVGLPTPIYTGHTFQGWVVKNGDPDVIIDNNSYVTIPDTHMLVAVWTGTQYTVHYDEGEVPEGLEHSELPADEKVTTTEIELEEALTITKQATDGKTYAFGGWITPKGNVKQPGDKVIISGDETTYTLTAKWDEVTPHTVTFAYAPGYEGYTDLPEPVLVEYGDEYKFDASYADMKKDNDENHISYKAYGWVLDPAYAVAQDTEVFISGSIYEVTSDVTFFLHWNTAEVAKATITYDVASATGTQPDDVTYYVGYDVKLAEQGDLKYEGKTFAGWNDGTDTYAAGSAYTMPEGGATLTAVWTDDIIVTYITNYGDADKSLVETFAQGETYKVKHANDLNAYFTRDDAAFAGWNTEADGTGIGYAVGTQITESVELYAVWTELYTISYNANLLEGSELVGNLPADQKYASGKAFNAAAALEAKDAAGGDRTFEFVCWSTTQNGKGGMTYRPTETITVGSEGLTLFAQWQETTEYEVTLTDENGFNVFTPETYQYQVGAQIYMPAVDGYAQQKVDRTIYTADGWVLNPDYILTPDADLDPADFFEPDNQYDYYTVVGDVTFYLHWSYVDEQLYTVTFDWNGGTSAAPATATYYAGQDVVFPTVEYDDDHHIFDGWTYEYMLDGKKQSGDVADGIPSMVMPEADLTLTAKWIELVDVVYHTNFEPDETVTKTATKNAQYQLLHADDLGAYFVRNDAVFTGWNTRANGTGTGYSADDYVDAKNGLELYAVWTQEYTLAYDENLPDGAALDESTPVPETKQYPAGETPLVAEGIKAVDAAGGTRTFKFLKWNTRPDGSGQPYGVDAPITIPKTGVTLYAQWEETTTYEVSFSFGNVEGVDGDLPETETVAIFTKYQLPSVEGLTKATDHATHMSYTADGWVLDEASVLVEDADVYTDKDTYEIVDDTTFYVHWYAHPEGSYTLTYAYNGLPDTDPATYYYYVGDDVTVADAPNWDDHHEFAGWLCTYTLDGVGYEDLLKPGDSFEMPEADVTLTAQWTVYVDVIYHTNVPKEADVTYTELVEVNTNSYLALGSDGLPAAFTRDEYALDYWRTAKTSGQRVEIGYPVTVGETEVNLYAVWKYTPEEVEVIAQELYDGTYGIYYAAQLSAEDTAFNPTVPVGQVFKLCNEHGKATESEPAIPLPEGLTLTEDGKIIGVPLEITDEEGVTFYVRLVEKDTNRWVGEAREFNIVIKPLDVTIGHEVNDTEEANKYYSYQKTYGQKDSEAVCVGNGESWTYYASRNVNLTVADAQGNEGVLTLGNMTITFPGTTITATRSTTKDTYTLVFTYDQVDLTFTDTVTIPLYREAGKDAGKYKVYAVAADVTVASANEPGYEFTVTKPLAADKWSDEFGIEYLFTINPKPVNVIDWTDVGPYDYDGKAHNPTAVIGYLVDDDTCNAVYTITSDTAGVPLVDGKAVNAGTYTMTVTGTDNGNYKLATTPDPKEFIIEKASNTLSNVVIHDWTYGDDPILPTFDSDYWDPAIGIISCDPLEVDAEGKPIENVASRDNRINWMPSGKAPTEAGYYRVNIRMPETMNYKASNTILKYYLTISPKPVSVTFDPTMFEYDKTAKLPTMTIDSSYIVGGDTVTVTAYTVGPEADLTGGEAINAGRYTVTATKLSNPNYVLDGEQSAKFIIFPRFLEVDWIDGNGTDYDVVKDTGVAIWYYTYGVDPLPVLTFKNPAYIVDNDVVDLEVTYYRIDGDTDPKVVTDLTQLVVGRYMAAAMLSGTDCGNYLLDPTTGNIGFLVFDILPFGVVKATPTVTPPTGKMDLTYTGSAQGLVNDDGTARNGTASVPGTFLFRDSELVGNDYAATITGTDAKEYTLYWKFVPDDTDNYYEVVGDTSVLAIKAKISSGSSPTPGPGTGSSSSNPTLTLLAEYNGKIEGVEPNAIKGKISADKQAVSAEIKAGTTIKLIVTANDNYLIDKVTYTKAGSTAAVELPVGEDGTCTFNMTDTNATVTATFKAKNDNDPSIGRGTIGSYTKGYEGCDGGEGCPLRNFRDLDPYAWYHDAIHFCLENHIMQGFGTPDFLPNVETTRAQVVTTLWNIAGNPIATSDITFSDVHYGDWYYDAIMWAAANGIVNGYPEGDFRPDQKITHEEIAKIFYGYAEFYGFDVSARTDIINMPGYDKVSPWARDYVSWGVASGLCCGKDGNASIIAATEKATRAELAATILNFCTLIAGNPADAVAK